MLFGPAEVGSVLAGTGAGPEAVALLFFLQLGTLAASAWIWHYLLNREGKIAFGSVFLINQAAGLVESLTPSVKFGGEAAKIYLFRQRTGQTYGDITGILLLHKLLTMAPFTFLCILLFPPAMIYFDPPPAFYASLLLLVAACVVLYRRCYSADPGRSDPAGKIRPVAGPSSGHADNDFPGDIRNKALNRFSRIGKQIFQMPRRSVSFLHQARLTSARLLTPRKDGPLIRELTLDCLQINESGEIHAVPDESILEALGFRPGKRVCLRCRARFGGPLVAEIEGRHTALARSLARKIHLRCEHAPAARSE